MRQARFIICVACCLFGTSIAHAGPVGDIQAVYNAPSTYNFSANASGLAGTPIGIRDGVFFAIENNGAIAITNATLRIGVGGDNPVADSFFVGTIAPHSYVTVAPGISKDGNSGHTFFSYLGGVRDESDSGPASNDVPFSFDGILGSTPVQIGTFTPAATVGPSNDNTIPQINFLGGGPNSDGACNNCVGPIIVAYINTPNTVPAPAGLLLLLVGGASLSGARLLRRS